MFHFFTFILSDQKQRTTVQPFPFSDKILNSTKLKIKRIFAYFIFHFVKHFQLNNPSHEAIISIFICKAVACALPEVKQNANNKRNPFVPLTLVGKLFFFFLIFPYQRNKRHTECRI